MGRFDIVQKTDKKVPIEGDITLIRGLIENLTGKSADIILHEFTAGNVKMLGLMCDGMSDQLLVSESILKPLKKSNLAIGDENLLENIKSNIVTETDIKEVTELNKAIEEAMAGFFIVFAEGQKKALSFSVQGFEKRSIDEPVSEVQERGSREGFTENFKVNMTLIRRRMRSPDLRFEFMTVGETANNRICLCYLDGRVNDELLKKVIKRLSDARFDNVLSTGYLQPYLDTDRPSLFSGVGITERPDIMVAKLSEGKVGIILDGTPYALYVPHIFIEDIHTFDDYAFKPSYATFIRALKLFAFLISFALPGLYVAAAIFHQELFPEDMLFNILSAELKTPFPVMIEALSIHLIFEIMREAGLRMPKTVGHAVSIVGALVIGDAAVTAGLIAAPMLIIVGLTAISSFVTPTLYNSTVLLRLLFIIIGGTMGLYGIVLGLVVLVVSMTSVNPFGVPYTSPTAPLIFSAMRDTIYRQSWTSLGKKIQVNRTLEKETE